MGIGRASKVVIGQRTSLIQSSRPVYALPDGIQTRRHSETTGSRQEEPQDASQHGTSQRCKEGKQWEAVGSSGKLRLW